MFTSRDRWLWDSGASMYVYKRQPRGAFFLAKISLGDAIESKNQVSCLQALSMAIPSHSQHE